MKVKISVICSVDVLIFLRSSVHETIVVRYRPEHVEMFSQMVKDVNCEVVNEKEILSDDIFEMDLVTGKMKKYEV